MIKCVIFDYGDTLVDSKAAVEKARAEAPERKVLAKHGLKFSKKQIIKAFDKMMQNSRKIPEKQIIKDRLLYAKEFLKALKIKPTERLAQECENTFYEEREKHRKPMPHALKLLKFLKKKKITLCVITNTRTNSNKKHAKKIGLLKYFKHFIMSHEFGSVKSELKIFNHLLEKLNKNRKNKIKPQECLMVGNHAREDGAAKLIGMKTAIYTKHLHGKKHLKKLKPDYIIKSLKEVERIVTQNT